MPTLKKRVKKQINHTYAYEVKDVHPDSNQQSGEQMIVVDVDILEDGKVVVSRSYGFPATTKAEDIEPELVKAVQVYVSDKITGEAAAPQEAMTAEVNKLRDGLLHSKKTVKV